MGKPTPRLPGAFGCLVPGRDDPRHQGGDSFQEATPVCEQEVGCQRHASHGDHGGGAEARLTRGFLDRDQRHGLRPWAIFAGRGKASRRQEYPAETIGAATWPRWTCTPHTTPQQTPQETPHHTRHTHTYIH
ncbi:unnamed protein product, partial [Effrenium voratum]